MKPRILWLILAGAVVAGGVYWFGFRNKGSAYQFISVTQGNIVETVSVTGNTTPVESLNLGFQNGGTIATVNYRAGDSVNAGAVIATLDTNDLRAELAQAQAAVDAANATLANMEAGAEPANIQASQATVAAAEQSLANTYANVPTALQDAYAKANDAVRNQLAPFFSGAETGNPQLTYTVNNSQTLNDAENERAEASAELNLWDTELAGVTALSPTSTLEAMLARAAAHLTIVGNLLATIAQSLVEETSLPPATLGAYKTAVTAALTENTSASSEVNGAEQSIASEKIAITQAVAQLNLILAGTTADQIRAQEAGVEQAQANVQGVEAKIAEASIVSPIDGVVTAENAKVGEIASAGEDMVSIISNGNLEVDAYVPETDIGKVTVGDAVDMTLDAFQGETFIGKVFYIDPAQTIISGVVDYRVKVSFDKADPRMKSGLTVNLNIKTDEHDNVLILPQFAVLQTDQGSFVEVIESGAVKQIPITVGIRDEQGNIEITSGVTAGEEVLNIGLKSS